MKYNIKVNHSYKIMCDSDETLLMAMRQANIHEIVFGCFGGGCGKCLIRIDQGNYRICKSMSKEHIKKESKDRLLACCVKPMSDMEISILKEHIGDMKNGN